jgi:ABC-2 type transport system ATP-binding protein
MAAIWLDHISLAYPIYDSSSRSLRRQLIKAGTGGRVLTDAGKHVQVQALEDISLSLAHGDRLALIGHNGAGKSTLLRVLAGIYEPLAGRMYVEGRTVPLFDITLGMDPEATGYENIRLRSMMLGLSRVQSEAMTEEIADFAELGSFLDMPVKTYSAGMRARLAFAISTCIQPDILLLDEGIGAGDAAFMEKANRRLEDFIHHTGILVLASHSESLLRQWCTKGLVLNQGRAITLAPVEEALACYAAMQ